MRKGLAEQAKALEEMVAQAKALSGMSLDLRELAGRFQTR
jgi:hypothetical protein